MCMNISYFKRINKRFDKGVIKNNNLAFELSQEYKNNRIRDSHITRALVGGHTFNDGNKRTAAFHLLKQRKYNEENLFNEFFKIDKRQITNTNNIRKRLRRCEK